MAHRFFAYDETFSLTLETVLLMKGKRETRLIDDKIMSLLHYEPGEIAIAKGRRVEILSVESLERILCRGVKPGKTQYFLAQE